MKLNKILRNVIIISIIALNIGCDQISKSILRKNVEYYERIHVIDQNLIITKVENKGAFLGMGSNMNSTIRTIFLLVIPSIVMIALLIYVFVNKKLDLKNIIGMCFIIGGGIGNIYDRIIHGSVTDFFHIRIGIFKTGIFNMADVSVMVGTGLILLLSFLDSKKEKAEVVIN